jgi:hypothetical protein
MRHKEGRLCEDPKGIEEAAKVKVHVGRAVWAVLRQRGWRTKV